MLRRQLLQVLRNRRRLPHVGALGLGEVVGDVLDNRRHRRQLLGHRPQRGGGDRARAGELREQAQATVVSHLLLARKLRLQNQARHHVAEVPGQLPRGAHRRDRRGGVHEDGQRVALRLPPHRLGARGLFEPPE